jgi:hypothetical protein
VPSLHEQLAKANFQPFIFTLFRYTPAELGRRWPTLMFHAAGAGGVANV